VRQIICALVCATALGVAAVSGALAQPAPASYNWTGFYIGVNGGFGGGVASPTYALFGAADSVSHFPGFTTIDAQAHRLGGFMAGGQAGYLYQFRNNVVVGVESDLQWSNIGALNGVGTAIALDPASAFPTNSSTRKEMTISQNWFGTTRLRLGYQFADRFLAYVTGGIAYSEFSAGNLGIGAEQSPFPVVYSHISGAATSTRIGWTAGAGFEYALDGHFSIKSEYLYSEYTGFSAPYLDTELSIPAVTSGTFSTGTLGIHQVRAGLNYRLGEGGEAPGASRLAVNAPLPPSFNWSGFYVGVNGGYGGGFAKPTLSESNVLQLLFGPSETINYSTNETLRTGGFAVGGQLGYNQQLSNRFLVGVETDLQWSDVRAANQSNLLSAYNFPAMLTSSSIASTTIGQSWFGTTRLRLGYLVSDRLLAYATGGVAYSSFSADHFVVSGDNSQDFSVTTTIGPRNSTRVGWTAGTGVEYALSGNLSFKTEYLYTEYAGFAVPYQTAAATDFSSTAGQGTFSTGTLGIHLVRAGLNLKFGESGR
jgi:outer membrane immunogenic protein